MRQWLGLVERGFGGCRSERRALRSVELGEKGPGANQCALDEAVRMGEVRRPHVAGVGSGEHDELRLACVARDVGAMLRIGARS